jgi:hypothetical protein
VCGLKNLMSQNLRQYTVSIMATCGSYIWVLDHITLLSRLSLLSNISDCIVARHIHICEFFMRSQSANAQLLDIVHCIFSAVLGLFSQ